MVNVHYKSESERKITQTQTHSIIQTESEKSPPLQTRKKTYNHKHTPNTITCVHTHTHTHALPTSQLVKRKSTLGRFCQCCLTRDRATCRVRNTRCTEITARFGLSQKAASLSSCQAARPPSPPLPLPSHRCERDCTLIFIKDPPATSASRKCTVCSETDDDDDGTTLDCRRSRSLRR